PQVLASFKEYTPPVTYPEEVEETLGTPVEVEPLDKMKLEDVGFNTCNHDIPLSYREVLSFDEPDPQPQPLPSCSSLDVSLGDKRSPVETDIRQKDEKSSKNGQNQAQNGKA
ncbi:hypothetical protein Tco_1277548, partial [Tanacetum coccineum]